MNARDIQIWGIVQGVGFRPFIYRMAQQNGIRGWVRNEGGSVRIFAYGSDASLDTFSQDISLRKPLPSEIIRIEVKTIDGLPENVVQGYENFSIIDSLDQQDDLVFLSPDLSVCKACADEMHQPADRRYQHPFISCMECGPRYSIIDKIPYDHCHTTMNSFSMCPSCLKEYQDPTNRRYHAQTISCHNCGPQPIYQERKNSKTSTPHHYEGESAVKKAVEALQTGQIIAVKGIGGYHFCCSPNCDNVVTKLRLLKGREEKPFAVMFQDLAQLQNFCLITPQEASLLDSREKPIVLLQKKEPCDFSASVDKGSRYLGAFLPYTPLQVVLLEKTGPLIMTSANISGQPIITEDEELMTLEGEYLSGILTHTRRILTPMDDTVLRCYGSETLFIRKSRGYTPLPIDIGGCNHTRVSKQVLALGGQLKSTFTMVKSSFAYVSQHFGDLDDEKSFVDYRQNIERMKALVKIEPTLLCCDLHPDYRTTRLAVKLHLPILQVQHHFAHIASVMAEKNLEKPMIGVAFDGTGFGHDGKLWGGEFLICTAHSFTRAGHLRYLTLPGGNSSVKDAWKTGLSYLYAAGETESIVHPSWPVLKAALEHHIHTIESSSMGRLFDAVSSILDIRHTADYEGQCAIDLETAAFQYDQKNSEQLGETYPFTIIEENDVYQVELLSCIRAIYSAKGIQSTEQIAYIFHNTVTKIIIEMCKRLRKKYNLHTIALSGGVFQNALLFEKTVCLLKQQQFQVFYNTIVPPNDGGISLGQAYVALHTPVDSFK